MDSVATTDEGTPSAEEIDPLGSFLNHEEPGVLLLVEDYEGHDTSVNIGIEEAGADVTG
ncbi:unnamed protein product, partial [Allacma fusca]